MTRDTAAADADGSTTIRVAKSTARMLAIVARHRGTSVEQVIESDLKGHVADVYRKAVREMADAAKKQPATA